jgi:hypothetical protein
MENWRNGKMGFQLSGAADASATAPRRHHSNTPEKSSFWSSV